MMIPKSCKILASTVLMAVLLTRGASAADDVVTFTETVGSFGTLQVMRALGICKKHGIDCRTVTTTSTPLAVQALLGGSANVASGSTDVMIQAAIKGADLTMVWGQWRYNPVFVAVAKSTPMPHQKDGYPAVMQDFKGKTIGVSARGASTEFQFVAMLQGAGMSASDVNFVAVAGPPTALGALRSRQVDAIVSWQPAALLCTTDDYCNVVIDTRENEGPPEITDMNGAVTVVVVQTKYLKANEGVVERLLRAFEEANAWMHDPQNFEEYVKLARPLVNFGSRPDADEILRKFLKIQLGLFYTTIDRRSVQAAADYLYSTRQIKAPYDASRLVWDKAPQP
jgi:NitT/TauT family transport system substrate-binding protein